MHVQSCCFAYKTYCFLTFSLPSASLDLKVPNRHFAIRWRDSNENVKNNNRFGRQNHSFARASHCFVHFFAVFFTATTWNCLIRLFREKVNERGRNFILSLNLNVVHRDSTPGGFAYIWQSRWVGIIALKTERTQVHFWSDVFAAVASSDRKITNIKNSRRYFIIISGLVGASNNIKHLQVSLAKCKAIRIPESGKLLFLESGIWEN